MHPSVRVALIGALVLLIAPCSVEAATFHGVAGSRIDVLPALGASGWLDLSLDLGAASATFATDISAWPEIRVEEGISLQGLWGTGGGEIHAGFDVVPVDWPRLGFRLWLWPLDLAFSSRGAALGLRGAVGGDLSTRLAPQILPDYELLLRLSASSVPRSGSGWIPPGVDSVVANVAIDTTLAGPLVGLPQLRCFLKLDLITHTQAIGSVLAVRFGLAPAGFDALIFSMVAELARTILRAEVTVRRGELGAWISLELPFGTPVSALPLSSPDLANTNPFAPDR